MMMDVHLACPCTQRATGKKWYELKPDERELVRLVDGITATIVELMHAGLRRTNHGKAVGSVGASRDRCVRLARMINLTMT